MFRLIVLSVAIVSCTSHPGVLNLRLPEIDLRIVGGKNTTIEEHPWQVSLRNADGHHYCGGSLISKDAVVTAAHCTPKMIPGIDTVVVGTSSVSEGGTKFNISRVIVNKDFDSLEHTNDIAILKLDGEVEFSDSVKSVNLPEQDTELPDGTKVIVTGWGTETEDSNVVTDILKEIELNIIELPSCQEIYFLDNISESMICAGHFGGGRDSCKGDSGGPLTRNGTLYGIVSWGLGCGTAYFPGVYSNVANLRPWIKENTGI